MNIRPPVSRAIAAAATGVCCMALPAVTAAQGPPAFQKGMWEFTRTIDSGTGAPQTMATKRCASPSEDMRVQREKIQSTGCKMSPATSSGSKYTFTLTCDIKGVAVQSTSMMTVESASAYQLDVQGQGGGRTTKEHLVAKRVGDC